MAYELVNEKTVCPQKSKKIMIEMEIKHYLDDKKKCIPIQSLKFSKHQKNCIPSKIKVYIFRRHGWTKMKCWLELRKQIEEMLCNC